ncbi:uroporphyrinogen-III synthase [Bacillus sp. 165]|uniref:uroporphyrinogen-III synthase n=1 Tax=Bacillus sp. 165 TaxID=1529117 RepID=UPI001ADB1E26|nr:uroporphyrinogen-III synthase [Bacillus sp. 165]MBO9130518.1 uroporphyrinogen-III synthase [Bacillus sp. 165]
MTDSPLQHKAILIMRAAEQGKETGETIREYNAIPFVIPLLCIVPSKNDHEIECVLKRLTTYEWVFFTSKNAVHHFFKRLHEYDMTLPKGIHIAAVGIKTKQAIQEYGYETIFTPSKFVAESFAKEIQPLLKSGTRVLFPKGNLARDIISQTLREQGIIVDDVLVYETLENEAAKEELLSVLSQGILDVITFTSPSTVHTFMKMVEGTDWKKWTSHCKIACIGPITAKAAQMYELYPHMIPEEYTIGGLLSCISEYYRSEASY